MAAHSDERIEKRRAEILHAASRVFAAKGYHVTNVADIAAELRIGHGTVYRYYKNKLDLFTAVIDSAIEKILDVVRHETPDATKTVDEYHAQLKRIGKRLYALFLREKDLSQLFFTEALGSDREVARTVETALSACAGFTQQYLENGVIRGFLRKDLDVEVTAMAINAMIFEGARQVVRKPYGPPRGDGWIEAVADLVIRGVRK